MIYTAVLDGLDGLDGLITPKLSLFCPLYYY